ncbi:hypothetical protein [Chitinolyticbacter albus]|uniref:hypothetical protein n=1 Tax=Chitinolyticbacter albus TaxID=2961951 RepID=UPI002108EA4B|nr:hypothetical protein [Chitinolyticbacter albus]
MNQLQGLGLTLACEVPVMVMLARSQPTSRVFVAAVLASAMTHPIAWKMASILSPHEYRQGLWAIEAGVVLAEATWYHWWLHTRFSRTLLWSLLANATSFGLGWLLLRS